jgi:hypothetical protein
MLGRISLLPNNGQSIPRVVSCLASREFWSAAERQRPNFAYTNPARIDGVVCKPHGNQSASRSCLSKPSFSICGIRRWLLSEIHRSECGKSPCHANVKSLLVVGTICVLRCNECDEKHSWSSNNSIAASYIAAELVDFGWRQVVSVDDQGRLFALQVGAIVGRGDRSRLAG